MNLSVVIPLFDKKEYILNTLESVLNQSYPPQEILVINDGSTDGSEQLVQSLNHPLVKLIHQENAGVSVARNKGIALAKYEWVAFLDADDLWDITYLERIKELNEKYLGSKVLATNYRYQTHTGALKPTIINLKFNNNLNGVLNNYFQVATESNPPICSSAVVVFKENIMKIGGFPLGVNSGEDLLTWAKLAIGCQIAYTLSPSVTFVLDPAHSYDIRPNRKPQKPDIIGVELRRLYLENEPIQGLKSYISQWHKMSASSYLRLGMRFDCIKESIFSLKYNFRQPKIFLYILLCGLPSKLVNNLFKLNYDRK